MVGEGGATNGAGNAESNNVTYKENNNNNFTNQPRSHDCQVHM